jgi:hypothetical protein
MRAFLVMIAEESVCQIVLWVQVFCTKGGSLMALLIAHGFNGRWTRDRGAGVVREDMGVQPRHN